METKGITCKIPLELHNRISEEIRASGSTMSKFIEMVIEAFYTEKEKGADNMGKTRTMAFQISEELFQKIKAYLAEYEQVYGRRLTQKEFVIGLVEQALEEAEEEFAAARAAQSEDDAEPDEGQDNDERETDKDSGEDVDEDDEETGEDGGEDEDDEETGEDEDDDTCEDTDEQDSETEDGASSEYAE